MNDRKNEEMAGSISEPRAPEVKPARSLWPRPYENVRVEPSLEPPQVEDAPIIAPRVAAPTGDFDSVPSEGYQERAEPRIEEMDRAAPEPHVEPVPERIEEPVPSLAPEDIAEYAPPRSEEQAAEELTVEDILEEKEASGEEGRTVEDILEENAAEAEVAAEETGRADRVEPSLDAEPVRGEAPSISVDPFRVREDARAAAVLDAADHQKPALPGSGDNRTGQFVAMAAGVIVALALGAVGLIYGASALGFSFGGSSGDKVMANNPPPAVPTPVPTPVANASGDDLKAAQQQIEELQARLAKLEAEKAEAQKAADTARAEQTKAQETAKAEPPPAPAPRPVAAAPAPTPAPEAQPASPAPSGPATPAASANRTAAEAPAQPTPAPTPQQQARVELGAPSRPLAPPPSYEAQPSYEQPGPAASPEMPVLQNWAVRDVYNGIAVVQSGRGAPMEVEPGDELPGGNRVLAIRRLGGAWAVITERGIIAAR